MTNPKVAALATDLGLKFASDLLPIESADDMVEFTPTSSDYRNVQKKAGWVALYIAGPAHAVPTVMQGLELWPACFGTTTSPRDVRRIAQFWHAIVLHDVIWCESRTHAESLKTMLTDALDFRHTHLSFRFYNLKPLEIGKLAKDVAKTASIPVFDENERMRRLQEAVTTTLSEMKRIAKGEPPKREKRVLPWRKEPAPAKAGGDPVYDPQASRSQTAQKEGGANQRIGPMVRQTRQRVER